MAAEYESTLARQQQLITTLQGAECFDHPVETIQLIETHISWVLLTGAFAYKIKKGVDFGFLDYSTLELRRHWCEEELRLNRRTAPQLYLEVVAIGGTPAAPRIGEEPALEYAVKMRQFDQEQLLSQLADRGALPLEAMDGLAEAIARFHAAAEVAPAPSPYGTPEQVYAPVAENFSQIRAQLELLPGGVDGELLQRLGGLEAHAHEQFQHHTPRLAERKAEGAIRDCHGDLHLNNILLLDGEPLLFDCIEFNANLRIIDPISEIAFLVMDLEEHHLRGHATRLLNRYLELSGDYRAIALLRFYLGYRAMVRAKVATLRLTPESDATLRRQALAQFATYLELAERYAEVSRPHLLITHGPSGSGKSTLTEPLLERFGLIRLRSDLERKRLFGIAPLASSHGEGGADIYTAEATERTYGELADEARAVLAGGYSVIVDATFLQRAERRRFRDLAATLGVPFTLLSFRAPPTVLEGRVAQRQRVGGDPSEADLAVLQRQLEKGEPLGKEELADSMVVDTTVVDAVLQLDQLLEGFEL